MPPPTTAQPTNSPPIAQSDDEPEEEEPDEVEEESEEAEEDSEEADNQVDSKIQQLEKRPPSPSLDPTSGEQALSEVMDANFWRSLQGSLPCLEYSAQCLRQLQEVAAQKSPLLNGARERIELIEEKIAEAEAANKEETKLAILRPVVEYLSKTETIQVAAAQQGQPARTERRGFLQKILQVVTNPGGLLNDVVGLIAVPLFDATQGGSTQQKASAIAIAGLRQEVAQQKLDLEKLGLSVRQNVDEVLLSFDDAQREFRLARQALKFSEQQLAFQKIRFASGAFSPEDMMKIEASTDEKYAAVLRQFQKMRSQTQRLKHLVMGAAEAAAE